MPVKIKFFEIDLTEFSVKWISKPLFPGAIDHLFLQLVGNIED